MLPILKDLPSWLWAFGVLQMVLYPFEGCMGTETIIALGKGLCELGTFFDGVECGPCPSF
jgi:hypothetical protein